MRKGQIDFITMGCSKNLVDSEILMRQFEANGYHCTHDSEKIEGEALSLALRRRGILVRHFAVPRIRAYNRITIGTPEQMETLLSAIKEILEEGPDGTGKEAKRETK